MPDTQGVCPEPAQLAEFHAGGLAGQAGREVAKHTEACDVCRAELAELSLDDSLAHDLRELLPGGPAESARVAPVDDAPDPQREALAALLRQSAEGERYEILGELGRGGMGVVYEVRDRVLQRDLAMKVAGASGRSPVGSPSPGGRRLTRFLEEARITGQLDHPSIIPVHELDVDSEGRAFFTMRRVRGRDLHDVLEEFERSQGEWTLQRLLVVALRACDAVAYAHSKRVVHRDLKPANIMVGRFSAVYVMDWGVAKVVPEEGQEGDVDQAVKLTVRRRPGAEGQSVTPVLTLDGEVLGTPAYMAPEQALGSSSQVDFRADVYSMGAILYKLLSGQRPYHAETSGKAAVVWRQILDGPPEPLAQIAPEAPPELLAICERAMARDPDERYADMAGLAADLRAWLEGRVVTAYKTGVLVELRKWVGRNRVLAISALVASAVVTGLIVSLWTVEAGSRKALMQLTSTIKARHVLEVDPAQAFQLAIDVAETDGNNLTRTTLLAALVPMAEDALLLGGLSRESTMWSQECLHRAWSPDGERFVFGSRGADGDPVTIRVWDVKARRLTDVLFESATTENHIVFGPEGRRIASGGTDGSLSIHDCATGESLRLGNGRAHLDAVARLAFHPSGELLASASWDGSVRLWDAATGELVRVFEGHTGIVCAVEFDALGERLLSASGATGYRPALTSDQTVRVWEVESGECLTVFEGHTEPPTSARFSPDGKRVLSTSYDGTAQLWEASSGAVIRRRVLPGKAWDGAFSPDGSSLAVAFEAGFLVQDVESGLEQTLGPYEAHNNRAVTEVDFSPDGDQLLTIGRDRGGCVWDLDADARPRLALRLRMLERGASFGSWSPDGSMIATSGESGTRLWFAAGNRTAGWVQPTGSEATSARFHPLGGSVLLTFEDSPAYEYSFTRGRGLQPSKTLGSAPARDVATTASGSWTLVAEESGPVRLWSRAEDGVSRKAGVLECDVASLHPSPVSDVVGAVLEGGGAEVIDLRGEPARTGNLAEGEAVNVLVLSDDGQRVALGTMDGGLRVIDLADDRMLLDEKLPELTADQRQIFALCFYDSGARLLSAGPRFGVEVWDLEQGRLIERIGHLRWTQGGLEVLPGGQLMFTCSQWQPVLFLTELTGNKESFHLSASDGAAAHRSLITSWSFDREQRWLLTTSLDRKATLWNLDTRGQPWVTFAGHDAPILAGDLSEDGQWAVTADAKGRVYVWPTDPLPWARKSRPAVVPWAQR